MKTTILTIPVAVTLALGAVEASQAGNVIEGAVPATVQEKGPALKAEHEDIVLLAHGGGACSVRG